MLTSNSQEKKYKLNGVSDDKFPFLFRSFIANHLIDL